jgi:hypothetical protein
VECRERGAELRGRPRRAPVACAVPGREASSPCEKRGARWWRSRASPWRAKARAQSDPGSHGSAPGDGELYSAAPLERAASESSDIGATALVVGFTYHLESTGFNAGPGDTF